MLSLWNYTLIGCCWRILIGQGYVLRMEPSMSSQNVCFTGLDEVGLSSFSQVSIGRHLVQEIPSLSVSLRGPSHLTVLLDEVGTAQGLVGILTVQACCRPQRVSMMILHPPELDTGPKVRNNNGCSHTPGTFSVSASLSYPLKIMCYALSL